MALPNLSNHNIQKTNNQIKKSDIVNNKRPILRSKSESGTSFINNNETSPAKIANEKALNNKDLISKFQQEIALKIAHSEAVNQQNLAENNNQEMVENEDPIQTRIQQQLAIRQTQQEEELNNNNDNNELNEESQEGKLNQLKQSANAVISNIAKNAAKDLTEKVAKRVVWQILTSIGGVIISVISSILIFLAPILIPVIIVIISITLVYNYITQYKLSTTYYYITGNYEKILINSLNNIPPDETLTNNNSN